ncbi:imelysin family protein [Pendulispora albinea]|uniref:Imelysin family protein n=1 Tax=Pendulispora albinea TaxID=2741071 RepID=A0ABZ2LUM1_9BACT
MHPFPVRSLRTTTIVAALLCAAALAALASAAACRKGPPDEAVYTGGSPSGPSRPGTPTDSGSAGFKSTLLLASADCALARYRHVDGVARAFQEAARAWGQDPANDSLRATARTAWRTVIDDWQETELFRFGPAARSTSPGGKNLRDPIYPWPLVSRCKMDEQIVDQAYARPGFGTSLVTGRGLSAYEYLAFYDGSDNGCSASSPINANGTWRALDAEELRRRKAQYAAAVAEDVLSNIDGLVRAWDPAQGNFHREVATAGGGSKTFALDQDALNAINEAIFYIELQVKDLKLAIPLGISTACEKASCPEAVESLFAHVSKEHIKANLRGFRRLFQGCADDGTGIGFDDWLREVGAADLADRMLAALARVEASLDAVETSFDEALANSPGKLQAVYTALKALTDSMKTEFVTVLNLELPKGSEGDND